MWLRTPMLTAVIGVVVLVVGGTVAEAAGSVILVRSVNSLVDLTDWLLWLYGVLVV